MTPDGRSCALVAGERVVASAWSSDGRALIYVTMGESDTGEIAPQRGE
jgi:hypothetical protein